MSTTFEGVLKSYTTNDQTTRLTVETPTGSQELSLETMMLPEHIELQMGTQYVFQSTPDGGVLLADVVRRPSLLILFALFLIVVVLVTGRKGLRSLLAMVISFALLFLVLLPVLLQGANPILATILVSALLVPVTFFVTHGWNRKTLAASLGTIAALLVTGILATWAIDLAHLTGYTSEEITFLQMFFPEGIQAKGLLLAGVIISLLGILDDVTMTQAAVTNKLRHTNPKMSKKELFQKSMDVGKDHIASLVNTLVLVYVGAALPLLLLFMNDALPWHQVLNAEIVAEEVVRTLVGSIGLVLAVPFTTLLATWFVTGKGGHEESPCAH